MKLFYDRFFTDFSLICAFFPANAAIFLFQRTVVRLSIMCFRRFFALCNVKSVDFFPFFSPKYPHGRSGGKRPEQASARTKNSP